MSSDGNKDRSAWTWTSLGEVEGIALQNGLYKPASAYGRGTPIVRINDFNNEGRLVSSDLQRVEVSAREISTFGLREGDILVNRVNSLSHIGKSVKVSGLASPTIYESNMMRVRLNGGPLRPRFLAYYLQLDRTREYFRTVAKQAVAQASINQDDLMALSVPVPSLSEQDEVVEILWAWERIIETIERLILAKRERKRGLMQVLLTGKKRFTEYAHLAWRSAPLADYVASARKGKPASLNDAGRGVPYIGSAAFNGDYTSHTDDPSAVRCSAKDVLLLWDGEYAGKSTTGHVGAVGSTVVAITLKPGLDNVYLHNLLLFHNQRIRSVREGSGIPHMPSDFFTWFKPQLPPIEEQRTIASVLSTADEELRMLEAQLEAYELQKRGLMQQLLTGEKRVNADVPEAVPA